MNQAASLISSLPALVVSTTSWQWCLWCHRRLQKPAQLAHTLVPCTCHVGNSSTMLVYVDLCWSISTPIWGQVLNPYPGRSKSSVRTCTSRRDFLRVSTLILSLRLFTYLPDLKGRGQARLEPKLKLPAMPAILITCLFLQRCGFPGFQNPHFPSSNQQILPDPTIPELPTKSGSLPWTVDHLSGTCKHWSFQQKF